MALVCKNSDIYDGILELISVSAMMSDRIEQQFKDQVELAAKFSKEQTRLTTLNKIKSCHEANQTLKKHWQKSIRKLLEKANESQRGF